MLWVYACLLLILHEKKLIFAVLINPLLNPFINFVFQPADRSRAKGDG
jgi:hypothetical protein